MPQNEYVTATQLAKMAFCESTVTAGNKPLTAVDRKRTQDGIRAHNRFEHRLAADPGRAQVVIQGELEPEMQRSGWRTLLTALLLATLIFGYYLATS